MSCSRKLLESLFVDASEICSLCGGKCCKGYPGMYLCPERFFEIFPEALDDFETSLATNMLTTKVCMGVPIPVPMMDDGVCVFLSSSGCTLSKERRPCECLLLVPNEETLFSEEIHCKVAKGFSYVECFRRWSAIYERRSSAGRLGKLF